MYPNIAVLMLHFKFAYFSSTLSEGSADGLLGQIGTDVELRMLPIISKEATSRFQNSGY
jgi:hypothetical protein